MPEAIKQKFFGIYAQREQLKDVRVLGLIIFLIIVLLISWSGVKVIQTNYGLQKQISELTQENQVQQLKNNDLRLQNEYLNTSQYLELSARQNFGLGDAGETEVLVPKNVALAQLAPTPTLDAATSQLINHRSAIERNFQSWINFLLHRQSPTN